MMRDRLFLALFLAASIATAVPLWVGRYVPLMDYPNHLSMTFVWFHLGEPAWGFAPFYEVNPIPMPYWAHYICVYLLSFLFQPELAQKIFLTAALLALPPSLALYAHRMGRDPRLALLSYPLLWNPNLMHGFIAYVAGLPVLFLALIVLDRHAERPSAGRGAAIVALGVLLYFFHLLTWLLFLVLGAATLLLGRPRPRSTALALAPLVPSAALAAVCYLVASRMPTAGVQRPPARLAALRGVFDTPLQALAQLPKWMIDVHPGMASTMALTALGVLWLFLRVAPDREPSARRPSTHVEVAAAVALLLVFILPRSLIRPFYWYAISRRIIVVFALLLVVAIRGRIAGARRVALALAAPVAVAFAVDVALHFHRFNVHARDYDQLMAVVPPRKRVLPLIFDDRDSEVDVRAYAQWSSWVQLRQGGYVPWGFDSRVPVRPWRELAAPPWDRPAEFNFASHGGDWDYLLVRGPHNVDFVRISQGRLQKHKQEGVWELWQRVDEPMQ
jgi:hypothetical protein